MHSNPLIFISRQEIIDKINHFAGLGEAFLFAIDFDGEKGIVLTPREADISGIQYEIGKFKNTVKTTENRSLRFDFFPASYKTYKSACKKVLNHLQRGDSYLLNLTFKTPVGTNHTLSEIFNMCYAPYKLLVAGYFVVFSPEIFIRIHHSKISSYPMKGTIDASIPDAGTILLSDQKEQFEHNTIVDLIRNDLAMVATNVEVTRFRYLDRIHTNRGDLLQMSSEICADLPADYLSRLGDILFTLLPAGSVTGAPKKKTVQIIRKVEDYERGFYTGIFGYFDGKDLESAVTIRFIEETGEGLVFKSGGGITALSDIRSEYEEMIKKIYVPVI